MNQGSWVLNSRYVLVSPTRETHRGWIVLHLCSSSSKGSFGSKLETCQFPSHNAGEVRLARTEGALSFVCEAGRRCSIPKSRPFRRFIFVDNPDVESVEPKIPERRRNSREQLYKLFCASALINVDPRLSVNRGCSKSDDGASWCIFLPTNGAFCLFPSLLSFCQGRS